MGTILYDLNRTLNSVAQCKCGCVFVYTPVDIAQYEMLDPNTKKYKTMKQVICPKCKTIIDI